MITPLQQLDDGWPESAEQQGLLLLVLRYYITRQYIKDVLKVDKTSASIAGFGNTGPLFINRTERKRLFMTKRSRSNGLVLGSFLVLEIDVILETELGLPL